MERRNFFKTAAIFSAIPLFPALAYGSAPNGAGYKIAISKIEFRDLSGERKPVFRKIFMV